MVEKRACWHQDRREILEKQSQQGPYADIRLGEFSLQISEERESGMIQQISVH